MRDLHRTRAARPRLAAMLLATSLLGLLGLFGLGCGKEIGDDCIINSDCSPNGDRICILNAAPSQQVGYCTVQGCDLNTCPEEAVCVRFFTGSFSNLKYDRLTEDRDGGESDCSFDELCSLAPADACADAGDPPAEACGRCVPRSAEIRFCMRRCESDDDCREGFECRDLSDMARDGGEPVLRPGEVLTSSNATRFCAASP